MSNVGFNKILALSPKLEIFIRKVYWKYLSKISVNYVRSNKESYLFDFNKISNKLIDFGLKKGDILVLHASYDKLKKTGKTPNDIINDLLSLVGKSGTLAMNSARSFPEEKIKNDYINAEYNNQTIVYNVRKSRVWTGVLPHFMLKHTKSKVSRFPINPIVAIGNYSDQMMENNISEDFLSSCGRNSAWKFCVDKNALVVGLGTDLTHSLTIMHVAEELMGSKWAFNNWFRIRKFRVIDENFDKTISVKERKPIWGSMHFAERTLCKDLLSSGILKTTNIDGVILQVLRAKELIEFLNSKNKNGYPFFI